MEEYKTKNTIRLLSAVRLFKAEVNVNGAEGGCIEVPDYILHNLGKGDSFRFIHIGYEQSVAEIVMSPEHECMLHKHNNTIRNIAVIKGKVYLHILGPDDYYRILNLGDQISIPCDTWHQMRSGTKGALIKEKSYYQSLIHNYPEDKRETCEIDIERFLHDYPELPLFKEIIP